MIEISLRSLKVLNVVLLQRRKVEEKEEKEYEEDEEDEEEESVNGKKKSSYAKDENGNITICEVCRSLSF